MRSSQINRETRETKIDVSLSVDGSGITEIITPIGFLSHMMEAFGRHSLFDLTLKVDGDIEVDQHHTIEDLGYVLGLAVKKALGKRVGIQRSGNFIYPMDEALALVAVDLSGRPYVQFDVEFKRQYAGGFDTDLTEHFFEAFARGSGSNIAVRLLSGKNDHHKLEAIFKAFAKAIKKACEIDPRMGNKVPSTKEVLDL